MIALVTLFVGTQLTVGLCALVLTVWQAQAKFQFATEFQPGAKTPQLAQKSPVPAVTYRTSDLYISEQCGWR